MTTLGQGNRRMDRYFNNVRKFDQSVVELSEESIRKAYLQSFEEIEKKLSRIYLDNFDKDPQRFRNNLSKYNRLKSIQNDITEELRKLGTSVVSSVRRGAITGYQGNWYTSGYMYNSTMGMDLHFGKVSAEAVIGSLSQFYDFSNYKDSVRMTVAQLNANIRNAISQSVIQGHSIDQASALIKKSFSSSFSGAQRIARTEILRATSLAQLQSYELAKEGEEDAGVKLRRYWKSTKGDRTRDAHVTADNQNEDKSGLFHLNSPSQGSVTTRAPRLSGVADQDINCRCTTGTRITDQGDGAMELQVEIIEPKKYFKDREIPNMEKFIGKIIPAQTINK